MSFPNKPLFDFNPQPPAQNAFRDMFGDPFGSMANPTLHPSTRNYGQFSTGGGLHDTFKVDRYENLYNGHTTLDLGNNQKFHLDW